jgi:hypothetical protein
MARYARVARLRVIVDRDDVDRASVNSCGQPREDTSNRTLDKRPVRRILIVCATTIKRVLSKRSNKN